jgi:hypothetical protein
MPTRPIDPREFGVSFSVKQCRNFGIDPQATMVWLIQKAGFRRFRLMSYWNEHEPQRGTYDFTSLDAQITLAQKHGCVVTLCLGVRQPRWPENHWPEWAWNLPKKERAAALLAYVEKVVTRYRNNDVVISYQLENEALLKAFGQRPDVDRKRLRAEFKLVKKLDRKRPVIMSTSTSWGIPLRRPIPDIVGFSFYRIVYSQGKYHHALHFPLLDRLRAGGIFLHHRRRSFIHELQLEPWGPANIWEMTIPEQDNSMSVAHIRTNLQLAQRTKLSPIDLWGGEWWYWRYRATHDPSIWLAVEASLQQSTGRRAGAN